MTPRIPCILAALLASACVPYANLKSGTSSEAEVRQAMGAPGLEIANADGSRQFAYPHGPMGTETFMVFLRKDGVYERVEQVLTDDSFARIRQGTSTRDDVRRLIGPPSRITRFDNLKQDAWDYRYRDSWGYQAILSVMIDDLGVVAGKIVVRIEGRGDSKGH